MKLKTKAIIATIEKWSPKGLCEGQYIRKNGAPEKTEACSVGCLVAEVLVSEAAIPVFKLEKWTPKKVVKQLLSDEGALPESVDKKLDELVDARFGTTHEIRQSIVEFNDGCVGMTTEQINDYGLPRDLKRVIVRLRKKYEELHA